MKRIFAVALVAAAILCCHSASGAADAEGKISARELLQGCLNAPSKETMVSLASTVGATPYSDARIKRELSQHYTPTVVDDTTRPDEAQKTEGLTTAFAGWDLPGSRAGVLEYSEGSHRWARVELATGQLLTQWRGSISRSCRVAARVVNGRWIFELYETLQKRDYGLLISADRRAIIVFTFEPDRYDTELYLAFDSTVAGLPADTVPTDDTHRGASRLIVVDGGDRVANDPGPGVPVVRITRAELLKGLDRPALMNFGNEAMEPLVSRLS